MGGDLELEGMDQCLGNGVLLGMWFREVCADCKLVAESHYLYTIMTG